jgi:hypothetical protein
MTIYASMVPPAKLSFSGTAYHVWRLDTSSEPQHNSLWNGTEGLMDRQEHRIERRLAAIFAANELGGVLGLQSRPEAK